MTYAYGNNFLPGTVGFDRLFSTLNEVEDFLSNKKPQSYPPYNIVKFDDSNYQIQIAVAGFDKNEIDIQLNQNRLSVNGSIETTEDQPEYLHRGLAARNFNHNFTLSDTIVVKSADIVNGVLNIDLENVIPEEKRPRKISIGKDLTSEK